MNKKTEEWKIFDLVAEGISFLDSKRAEFNKLLISKGIESTNALLIKKSLADIRFNKGKN
jgi:phospholipid transport system substrate-binding protein